MNTKAIALLLGLGLAATLTACGGGTTTETSPAASPEASPAAPAAPVSPAASPTTSPSP